MSAIRLTWFKKENQRKQGWDNQELAEFYRIIDILDKANMAVEVDQGLSDEGDPWFVFVRAETGDVVAHFARVDGKFISVSSLNQEVYSGDDIRQIVDKMLQRHPLILPKKGNDGKLFLHPGVVLTAFVAAAFLTSTSEGGNLDLKRLISSTFNPEENSFYDFTLTKPDAIRGDATQITARAPVSDSSQAFPNMALLGAALMAQDQWSEDKEFFAGNLERSLDYNRTEELTSEIFYLEDINLHPSSRLTEKYNDQKGRSEFDELVTATGSPPEQKFSESLEEVIDASEILWSAQGGISTIAKKNPASETVDEGLYVTTRHDLEEARTADLKFPQLVYSKLKVDPNANGEEDSVINDHLNYESQLSDVRLASELLLLRTVDSDSQERAFDILSAQSGKFTIVSDQNITPVEASDFLDVSFSLLEVGDVMNKEQTLPGAYSARAFSDNKKDTNSFASEPSQNVPEFPIVGHMLSGYGTDTVSLSDSIDVLFYDGGDMRVEGFELGKDLLWFFLPDETLALVDNTVVGQGNLSLDFGIIGNLTFVNLLSYDNDSYLL